jgi:hypothetical protein
MRPPSRQARRGHGKREIGDLISYQSDGKGRALIAYKAE